MSGQPKSAISEISSERIDVWHAIADSHTVDEIAVRRLIRKADAKIATLPLHHLGRAFLQAEEAYMYSYLGKLSQVKELLQQSSSGGFPEFASKLTASHALSLCGAYVEAVDACLAIPPESVSGEESIALAGASVHLGLFLRARGIFMRIDGFTPNAYVQRAITVAECMERIGVTDEDLAARLAVATEIVRSMSVHPLIAQDVFADPDHGILFRFVVRDGIDRLVEIDQAIDEALAERFNEEVDHYISIGITPHTEGSAAPLGDAYCVSLK